MSLFFVFRNLTTRAEQQEKLQDQKTSSNALIAAAIRQRITYVGAFFLLLYVGAEVTLGNWGYTYLISIRSGDTIAMAHVMSGYWAGICAGRLFLGYLTLRFGEKRMVFLYLCLIFAMLFVFWFVAAIAANAAGRYQTNTHISSFIHIFYISIGYYWRCSRSSLSIYNRLGQQGCAFPFVCGFSGVLISGNITYSTAANVSIAKEQSWIG